MAVTGTSPTTTSFLHLLRTAYDLGRADGALAADIEPLTDPGPPVSCCRGRDAEGFARHLWEGRPGIPPAGLIVNAPAWYGQGFREGLADARTSRPGATELPVGPAAHQGALTPDVPGSAPPGSRGLSPGRD